MSHRSSGAGTISVHTMRCVLMVLGLAIILLFILSMDGNAEYGAPEKNGTTDGDWTIEAGDDVVRSNETITIDGDIRLEEGSLTLINVTLIIQEKGYGFPRWYEIKTWGSANLNILAGSRIDCVVDGQIISLAGGAITITDSEINNTMLAICDSFHVTHSKLTNITYLSIQYFSIRIDALMYDNLLHFKNNYTTAGDVHYPFSIYGTEELEIDNNTIITDDRLLISSVSKGRISNNTFSHPNREFIGLQVGLCDNLIIQDNDFQFNGFIGVSVNTQSDNIEVRDNTFRSNGAGGSLQFGIRVSQSSHVDIYDNTFRDLDTAIQLNHSHSCSAYSNTIESTLLGIVVSNETHDSDIYENTIIDVIAAVQHENGTVNCDVTGNYIRDVKWAFYQINNAPPSLDSNILLNVEYHTGRANGLMLSVRDTRNRALDECNVTIRNQYNDIVYEKSTNAEGILPWISLFNMTSTAEKETKYAPYTVSIEKMGKTASETFDLPEAEDVWLGMKLDINFDVFIDIRPIFGAIPRGEEVPVNITVRNTGSMNFTHCYLLIESIGPDNRTQILNQTIHDLYVGGQDQVETTWFVEKGMRPAEYFVQAEIQCYNKHREDPHVEDESISFRVINARPSIYEDLRNDPNLTKGKNEIMVLNVAPFISDFENDLEDLILNMSPVQSFKDVVIDAVTKTITITPLDHFHGKILVNLTVTDLDEGKFLFLVPLTWINHDPVFRPDIVLTHYSTNQDYQFDLIGLATDEDVNETLVWNATSNDLLEGNISISFSDGRLTIARENDNVTSVYVMLLVFDISDANASLLVTIIWETNLHLSGLNIHGYDNQTMQDDVLNVTFSVQNVYDVIAYYDILITLDTAGEPIHQGTGVINGGSSNLITFPWTSVGGNHDIIVSMTVVSPLDRNLTNHVLRVPIIVYIPMSMTGSWKPDTTIAVGENGSSLKVTVFSPPGKGIDHIVIRIMSLSFNGISYDLGIDSMVIGGGGGGTSELPNGIIISVDPHSQNIDPDSNAEFIITITPQEDTILEEEDLIVLNLYAEGDDGKSNHIVLQFSMKIDDKNRSSDVSSWITPPVILLIGGILLPLGAVKVSGSLSNASFSMYKLSHFLFLHFVVLFAILCPLVARRFEDDEARYNEYRDEICKFLEARGGEGANIQEIMTHLKKWLPYGTTGNANPEDDRVTGVVREHLNVLRRKKYIKVLGDRYYYHDYQPALPEDVFAPEINWKSFLRDEKFKLKGETICQLISTFYKNKEEGLKNKELASMMDMTPYAIHYHIRKLEQLRIIEKKKGRGKRYFLNANTLQNHIHTELNSTTVGYATSSVNYPGSHA